jgi:hypothetical protein
MRHSLGTLLGVLGLLLMPVAVGYGLQTDDIFGEFLIFGAGFGLLLIGRSLREIREDPE